MDIKPRELYLLCRAYEVRYVHGTSGHRDILANTRSPAVPAATDIHLHVSPRPASTSVCTAYTCLSHCSAMNARPPTAQAAWQTLYPIRQ